MIKKIFWVGIGIGIGVLAVGKINQVRTATSKDGLNRAVGRLADSLAATGEAFRDGMSGRESELRTALGLASDAQGAQASPATARRY
ncbi:hypothetical protein [Arthrobacter sp. KK5.5]|uniref:hypothetical protein n=1 Tax=Arthrobacter sp. KK5.5 TaxID=3373084 RepID=UPI003EE5C2C3